MQKYHRITVRLVNVLFFWFLICGVSAADKRMDTIKPFDSQAQSIRKTVKMARGTWDTGWFHAEIYKLMIEALGYRVEGPSTMSNPDFYQAAGKGEIDLWVNSWLPGHNEFYDPVRADVEVTGYVVKSGAMQGYLIDTKTARVHNIFKLSDLKKPSIAELFDHDGNGKADLIGCDRGWGCAGIINHHLKAYGLEEFVDHIQGDYSPLMAETVERFYRQEPILFYTWTPNWTVGMLKPGRDVQWLEVPFASLPANQKSYEDQITVDNISGCRNSPCALGFAPNDIRALANRAFLKSHPDIRLLLEKSGIPLADISRQNAKMIDGEDRYEDIRNHAKHWIAGNRNKVDRWLSQARAVRPAGSQSPVSATAALSPGNTALTLRVVTQRTEPFVIYRNQRYRGFTIELWDKIAKTHGIKYQLYGVNTIAKLMDEVRRGAADVAVSGIGITSDREKMLDFSHSFLVSGLQIMVREDSDTVLGEVFLKVLSVIFAPELLYGVGLFLIVLIIAAHINWFLERKHNPQFSGHYVQGIWQSVWWAVVTVTTVGYGDKTPTGKRGRAFALLWILAGYFVFAYFTATVTSTVTVRELHSFINGPKDLYGKKVATVAKSTAAVYLNDQGIANTQLRTIEEAYRLLESGKVDAVVYDAPVLQHYARNEGKGKVKVVGVTFQKKSYGFAFPVNSEYRDRINVSLLELIENGGYQDVKRRWFGK